MVAKQKGYQRKEFSTCWHILFSPQVNLDLKNSQQQVFLGVTICKECTDRHSIFQVLGSPGGGTMCGSLPEACDGYFHPMRVKYVCLGVWTNQEPRMMI